MNHGQAGNATGPVEALQELCPIADFMSQLKINKSVECADLRKDDVKLPPIKCHWC